MNTGDQEFDKYLGHEQSVNAELKFIMCMVLSAPEDRIFLR